MLQELDHDTGKAKFHHWLTNLIACPIPMQHFPKFVVSLCVKNNILTW